MYSLNRATILGNVTRDPELRQTGSGQSVCSFSVATNRNWTDAAGAKQEAVEFHNCVAWAKLAEICGSYLAKGRKVYVDGRLQTREWDGQDGQKRRTTEIVVENMIILDRAGTVAGTPAAGSAAPAANRFSAPPSPPVPRSFSEGGKAKDDPAPNPDDEIKVEDIPF
ncbi:single-stranded DNA-binding protein [Patescibacteria group bacterium]|nr:MAG: single-stranded DNA-binding protein [Patescibacteria group bacterium]